MDRQRAIGATLILAFISLAGCISLQSSQAQKSPSQKNKARQSITLRNGAMTQGTTVPNYWHQQWVGKGKISVTRDTQIFKQGPAALKVASTSGPAKGQAFQLIQGSPNQSFTISGFAKSTGRVKVNVAIQSFSKKSRPLQFRQVQYLHNTQDWSSFSQEVTLPPKTHKFGIVLLIEGEGEAWLDEVKLTGTNVKNIAGKLEQASAPNQQDSTVVKKQQNPTVPTPGHYPKFPQAWQKLHQQHLQQTQKREINVVFLGDSITRGWQKHKKLWQKHYGKLDAVNFGIGGDRTQQVLWRINNGLFDQIQPQLVVLNIGVNNLWQDGYGSEQIAAGIEKIVAAIHTKSPKTKILLLGILPTGKQLNAPKREKIQAINSKIRQLDNGSTIRFLDMGSNFLEPDGSISKDVMPDYLHLSRQGYQIWATSMEKTLSEMLNE
ncbi:GDSL-type esterase/lipase family protein [Acaryochloris marina]|uniref:GDSL-like lipase/acylhydrolase domain containing protein n=1 Tax=Acaryochloris marina (strain MBIC 11017) TaxID=329726 RepID=B0CGA4_ACAM1|nr:GDSL-type esterase/lipase family protein [Acaryochloris marina]ABW30657.1 GDSL-like lipase/acylhydrolase domain containing protein [Acaryochloris marina MBIC11017]